MVQQQPIQYYLSGHTTPGYLICAPLNGVFQLLAIYIVFTVSGILYWMSSMVRPLKYV